MVPIVLVCAAVSAAPVAESHALGPLLDRIAADNAAGEAIVVTVHVALCDRLRQGVVAAKHPHLCLGNVRRNLYWTTLGGLKGYLDHAEHGWRRASYEEPKGGDLAARGVWKRRFVTGAALRARGAPKNIEVQVVGLAYRGGAIDQAVRAFFSEVGNELISTTMVDGVRRTFGGASHVVGFIGHNHLLEVDDPAPYWSLATGDAFLPKGAFALACISDDHFGPGLNQATTHTLLLNTGTTYPNAWTFGALVRGLIAGDDPSGIRRRAAEAHARVQKLPLADALEMFADLQPVSAGLRP